MIALSIFAASFGFVIQNSYVLAMAFLLLLLRSFQIIADFRLVNAFLLKQSNSDLNPKALAKVNKLLSYLPATTLAQKSLSILESMRFRQVSHSKSKKDGGSHFEIEKLDNVLSQQQDKELSDSEYYDTLLRSLHMRFRCLASAVIYKTSSAEDPTIFSLGLEGSKLKSCLRYFTQSYFDCGDKKLLGLYDCFDSKTLLGDFSFFGVRYCLSYPIGGLEASSTNPAVLWLGYSGNHKPTTTERRWLKSLATRISQAGKTRAQLNSLYREIKHKEVLQQRANHFIANVSHDIRTPLSNLRNILSIFKIEGFAADTPDMLDRAFSNCEQITDMIDDVLDYSSYQLGSLKPNPKEIDLSTILNTLVESFQASARIKGISLEFIAAEEFFAIDVDLKHLKRIVSNLLSNAIKYTAKGGVTVSIVSRKAASCSILVRDSGVGMNKQQLNQVFEMFTRFDSTGQEGLGLGLSFSKVLTELNQGKLLVTSQLGQGSEFEVRFPCAAVTLASEEPGEFAVCVGG